MYCYAISQPHIAVLDPRWQNAIRQSTLKRIEFSFGSLTQLDDLPTEIKILQMLQSEGNLEFGSIHIPFTGWGWNPCTQNETNRQVTVRNIVQFLKETESLQSANYTLHCSGIPEIKPGEDRAPYIAQFKRTLAEILPTAEKMNTSINVEILPRACLGNSAQEIADLIQDFPEKNVGVCFDVNHLNNAPEAIPAGIQLLAKRLRTFHLSDYDGIDECHWYPGCGVIDWPAVMAAIRQLPNDVTLIFEASAFVTARRRQKDPILEFTNAYRNIYYLEHCQELNQKIAELAAKGF